MNVKYIMAEQPDVSDVQKAQNEALAILVKGVHLAQARGAYSFAESREIGDAVQRFIVQDPKAAQPPANDFNSLKMNIENV